MSWLERRFGLRDHGTNVRTEVLAGFTTFLTMAYITVANPSVLQDAGMDFGRAVVVAAWPVLVVSGLIGVARGMVRRGTLGNG